MNAPASASRASGSRSTKCACPTERRGKSRGFRVIYYAQIDDVVTLLTIYSKTEIRDISLREIQALAQAADEARP